jgi:hypothetical protein
MPIPVLCPGCSVRLNAPDAAAGKNVKCPKCQTLMTIPAADGMDLDDAPPSKPTPKRPPAPPPKSAPVRSAAGPARPPAAPPPRKPAPVKTDVMLDDDEDDRPRRRHRDDEDDDDDRPRKKKGPAKKGGLNPGVLIGAGVLGVVLLGAGGYAVYHFTRDKEKDKETTASTGGGGQNTGGGGGGDSVPSGWVSFSPPNGGFKVNLPSRPINADQPTPRTPTGNQPQTVEYTTGQPSTNAPSCNVSVAAFPASMSAADKEKAVTQQYDLMSVFLKEFIKEVSRGKATLAGKEATELVIELDVERAAAAFEKGVKKGGPPLPSKAVVVMRWFVTENRGYFLLIAMAEARKPDQEKAFFDSFELTAETDSSAGPKTSGPTVIGPKTAPAGGWVSVSPPSAGFKVNMPGMPGNAKDPPPKAQPGPFPSSITYAAESPKASCNVIVVVFAPKTSAADKEKGVGLALLPLDFFKKYSKDLARGESTLAGKPAQEVVVEVDGAKMNAEMAKAVGKKGPAPKQIPAKFVMAVRYLVEGDRGYILMLTTPDARDEDAERQFFESFRLTQD